jgi:hypothetical protein
MKGVFVACFNAVFQHFPARTGGNNGNNEGPYSGWLVIMVGF